MKPVLPCLIVGATVHPGFTPPKWTTELDTMTHRVAFVGSILIRRLCGRLGH